MSANNENRVLPVSFTKEQRRRLGVMAAESCVAMTELLRWWVDQKWGERNGIVDAPKVVEVVRESKVMVDAPKHRVEDPVPVAPPVEESVGDKKRCAECNLVCAEWTSDRRGKPICLECAERLSGSNP